MSDDRLEALAKAFLVGPITVPTVQDAVRIKALTALLHQVDAEAVERMAKVCEQHGAHRHTAEQYADRYMQEVSEYARSGGSHPATVRFAARWLASAIRALPTTEDDRG